jgi:predicted CXXCH cytochrome family protein
MTGAMMRFPAALFCILVGAHAAWAQAYAGSAACAVCHPALYARWKKTRMANVVRDPRTHPEAVLGDFSKRDPALTFSLKEVAFVYGSKWKQRYFEKVGDDYYPLPAQWDIRHGVWRPYLVKAGSDWWTAHYGSSNRERPTGPLCDGCHSVNYDAAAKTVTEWNVGCERCHGPGAEHARRPSGANIVNPARLDSIAANDVCIQCHSQGRPKHNPIAGKYFDWPVGYRPGLRLRDFWRLEEHKPGETTFTHFADGSAHKNRMQGNDFVRSVMYTRGVTCFSCHDVHGTENDADLLKPASVMCLECHGPKSPNGPHAGAIEQHTQHKTGSPGGECVECHMPRIAQTIADVNVRSHTFVFIPPARTVQFGMPNACNVCHKDKSPEWAAEHVSSWPGQSPWRAGQ